MMRRAETAAVLSIAGGLSAAAATVMAGWHWQWLWAVQLVPGFVPVQFNTALGFLLASLSLACAARRRLRPAGVLAALTGTLSAVVGLQYLTGMNFGIDQLFVTPFVQARTAFPGRMAPNTAICFTLFSLALVYWSFGRRPLVRFNFITFAGVTLILVGVMVMAGYLAHVEAAYSWWGLSDMAPQTAAGLVLLGLASLALVHAFTGRHDDARMRLWLPAYATLGGIIMTVLIAQGILLYNKQVAQESVVQETRRLAGLVKLEMRVLAAVEHMRDRWDFAGGDMAAWQHDAERLVKNYTSYRGMALLDENFAALSAVPGDSLPFWAGIAPDAGKIAARLPGEIYAEWTRPDYLYVYTRVNAPQGNVKYLAAAYDLRGVMADVVKEYQNKGFTYSLIDGNGRTVYTTAPEAGANWEVHHEQFFETRGLKWEMRVALDVAKSQQNSLVLLVFIFGAVLSVLLAGALHQSSRIRQFQLRLERVLEQLGDGFLMASANGTIELANAAAERMFRPDGGGLRGTALRSVVAPDKAPAIDALAAQVLAGRDGEQRLLETEGCNASGDVFAMEISLARATIGQEVLLTALLRDISARKARENELQQSNIELEQFAYIASHDLKAPLRGIDNLAQWIAEDLAPQLNDDAREKFALLHTRVARLETLLEDILRYSRAGRMTGETERVDIADLVRQVAGPLTLGTSFNVATSGPMPSVFSPRTPLEQVFSNLIVNAIKHHDRGEGTITVAAADRGAFIDFSVSDDGPGIPTQFHARVFQMFQTLQSRDKKEGSGLGMAIVKKLVEWQGGRCWIETPPGGRGTAIHFLWRKTAASDNRH